MNLKTIKSIWNQSLEEFLIYKSTSIITFVLGIAFFAVEIIAGLVFFSNDQNINGWTKTSYLSLVTSTSIITYIYNIFFINGQENLAENIVEGGLDYIFLRPVSSYWYSVLNSFDIPSFVNLFLSVIFELYLVPFSTINLVSGLSYLLAIVLAVWFVFTMNQILICLSFWFTGLTAVSGIVENLLDFTTRPKEIFPKIIQFTLSWVFPILLVTNVPAQILNIQLNFFYLIYLGIFDICLYKISNIIWKQGTKHYLSAN
ncbi:ABC-2 family transporter protein [Oenococcus oeni]|uniref:ABC-2 family transporter protein n=1 Tax=Oenococcus oeni TaxID=1247 RepID=UPI0010B5D790|nr:ABC-2 family transporter protein [Oenococcus oeni]SYW14948.1 Membrane protein [Oenococcus oeni]